MKAESLRKLISNTNPVPVVLDRALLWEIYNTLESQEERIKQLEEQIRDMVANRE